MSCLACAAAARDAGDLLEVVVTEGIESEKAWHLLSGMDAERSWRALLFAAACAGSAAQAYARATGLPVLEVVQIIRDELTGGGTDHEH